MVAKNLWPDLKTSEPIRTVRTVLVEAASGLVERTDSKVSCLVETIPGGSGRFTHQAYLSVAVMGYRYPLFRVQEQGDPYPVMVFGDGTFQKGVACGNEAYLEETLRLLFNSDHTKRMIFQLLDLHQAA
ncbi:MAG: hypothetical protein K2X38_24685 [Gemmataceae bacterium]|nr:hypothetical protein [Gemmataceae bacterium]